MKDTIYLIVNPSGVDRMRKSPQSAKDLRKNEIPVKLNLEVDSDNWTPPFIEKDIVVNRWDRGIDVEDVHFEDDYVTEEEAEMIREHRIAKHIEMLEAQGYEVRKKDAQEATT